MAVCEGSSQAAQHTAKNKRERMMTERATVLFIYQTAVIHNTPTLNSKKDGSGKMIREPMYCLLYVYKKRN